MCKQSPAFLTLFLLATWLLVPIALANTGSHPRVVSLSFVQGTVIARRPGSSKWARAILNMPIEQGVSIATASHSLAEVEFENGSTVRLGELSRLDFTEMGAAAHNGSLDHLNLAFGFATIRVIPKRHHEYALTAAGARLLPRGKAEFRADLNHGHLRVEVFTGRLQVADATEFKQLRNNQVLACDPGSGGNFELTDTIHLDEWDRWVEARDRQVSLASYRGPGPGMYDWENDLIPFGGMGLLPGVLAGDGF